MEYELQCSEINLIGDDVVAESGYLSLYARICRLVQKELYIQLHYITQLSAFRAISF